MGFYPELPNKLYPGHSGRSLVGAMTTSIALHVVAGNFLFGNWRPISIPEPAPRALEVVLLEPEPPPVEIAPVLPLPAQPATIPPPEPLVAEKEPDTQTAEVKPQPFPVTDPEPVTQPAPVTEPEPVTQPAPVTDPEPEPAPKRKAKTKKPIASAPKMIKLAPADISPPALAEPAQAQTELAPIADKPPLNPAAASPKIAAAPEIHEPLPVAATTPNYIAAAPIPPHFDVAYLNNPKPAYPAAARRLKLEGTVVLRVMVKASGAPQTVELTHSSGTPLLDDAALTAVKGWRFVPARQGDTPIDHWVDVPIRFHLVDGR